MLKLIVFLLFMTTYASNFAEAAQNKSLITCTGTAVETIDKKDGQGPIKTRHHFLFTEQDAPSQPSRIRIQLDGTTVVQSAVGLPVNIGFQNEKSGYLKIMPLKFFYTHDVHNDRGEHLDVAYGRKGIFADLQKTAFLYSRETSNLKYAIHARPTQVQECNIRSL